MFEAHEIYMAQPSSESNEAWNALLPGQISFKLEQDRPG